MAKWTQDEAELVNLCFNYDWECSKVQKIIKDQKQLSEVKEFFRIRYKFIKDTYKYYSSINPVVDIWAMQSAQCIELLQKCQIMDNTCTLEFLMIKFTAVCSGSKSSQILPANDVLNQAEVKSSIYDHGAERVDYGLSANSNLPKPKYSSNLFFNKDIQKSQYLINKHLYYLSTLPVDVQGLNNNKNPRNCVQALNRY